MRLALPPAFFITCGVADTDRVVLAARNAVRIRVRTVLIVLIWFLEVRCRVSAETVKQTQSRNIKDSVKSLILLDEVNGFKD